MKRHIFTLLMVFVLAVMGTALMAQTATPSDPQAVDQSGQPETGPGPDVDVDTGKNAAGAVDVDVNSQTDPDTAASGVDETPGADPNMGATDTDNANLPDTGSELPLIGLVGLLALAGTAAVRSLR